MSPEQKKWLDEHAAFTVWRPHGVVSIYGWADIGYLMPTGDYVAEGIHHGWAWPMHLMSSGDTLYVMPPDAVKVGREYMQA